MTARDEYEYTRKCLVIAVAGGICAGRVSEALSRLISLYGAPTYLCSDNGREFACTSMRSDSEFDNGPVAKKWTFFSYGL